MNLWCFFFFHHQIAIFFSSDNQGRRGFKVGACFGSYDLNARRANLFSSSRCGRLPAFSDGSIIILERHGRDLVDDEDHDPNTLLVRPYVEDIWGTWAWDVPIDKQMNDLQEP